MPDRQLVHLGGWQAGLFVNIFYAFWASPCGACECLRLSSPVPGWGVSVRSGRPASLLPNQSGYCFHKPSKADVNPGERLWLKWGTCDVLGGVTASCPPPSRLRSTHRWYGDGRMTHDDLGTGLYNMLDPAPPGVPDVECGLAAAVGWFFKRRFGWVEPTVSTGCGRTLRPRALDSTTGGIPGPLEPCTTTGT